MARQPFFDPNDPRPQWRQFVGSWRFKAVLALNLGFLAIWVDFALQSPKMMRWPLLAMGAAFLLLGLILSTVWPPTTRLSRDNKVFFRVIMVVLILLPGASLVVAGAVAAVRAAR